MGAGKGVGGAGSEEGEGVWERGGEKRWREEGSG